MKAGGAAGDTLTTLGANALPEILNTFLAVKAGPVKQQWVPDRNKPPRPGVKRISVKESQKPVLRPVSFTHSPMRFELPQVKEVQTQKMATVEFPRRNVLSKRATGILQARSSNKKLLVPMVRSGNVSTVDLLAKF